MAYTFGGATTDDITWSAGTAMGADNTCELIMGWWFPTTLTAGRALWSWGNTARCEIDTTTSSIRIVTDWTTDGVRTAPVGLAVDTWTFIAVCGTHENTGDLEAFRVWAGTELTAPTEITVTVATTQVGTPTGNANFYIGNAGTGSVAFQGDIDEVGIVHPPSNTGGTTHQLSLATSGAISNEEAEFIYRRFVLPFWGGNFVKPNGSLNDSSAMGNTPGRLYHWPGDVGATVRRYDSASNANLAPTISGATPSSRRAPKQVATGLNNITSPYRRSA